MTAGPTSPRSIAATGERATRDRSRGQAAVDFTRVARPHPRPHRIIRICERQGIPVLADRAYIGAGPWVTTPLRRPPLGELAPTQWTVNRALSAARARVERSVARLKSRRSSAGPAAARTASRQSPPPSSPWSVSAENAHWTGSGSIWIRRPVVPITGAVSSREPPLLSGPGPMCVQPMSCCSRCARTRI